VGSVSVDRLVAQLGARQYGLITVRQLAQAGMTRGMRRRRVEDGRLQLFRHGVYAIAGAPPGWRQTVLGAVLAAGRDAVASHVTAGLLWDLKHCDRTRATCIHVTAPRAVRLEGVTGHVRHLNAGECQTRFSIPVTSPQQTILDLAATLTADQLGQCVDDALRRDLIHLERLRLAVAACGRGRRPIRSLRSVLAERDPGYNPGANDWEKDMDRSWEAWGLPLAIRQYRVVANNKRYRLDRAIPDLRIGIEWNGFETHGTRSGFDYDSDKRADLTAAGWHMLDFTSRSSPSRICRAVWAAVAQRQKHGPPTISSRSDTA
jgi:hypothetical protein